MCDNNDWKVWQQLSIKYKMQHFQLLSSTLSLMCFVILAISRFHSWNLDIIKLIKNMRQWDIHDFWFLIIIKMSDFLWEIKYFIREITHIHWSFIPCDGILSTSMFFFSRISQFQWKLLANVHSGPDSLGIIIIMIGSSYSNYKRKNLV